MFHVFTDSGSNLTPNQTAGLHISIVPLRCLIDGREEPFPLLPDGSFDGKTYYDRMRSGADVKTAMVSVGVFKDAFRAAYENGEDVLYVSLSAGISGTYQASIIAADELREEFPDRKFHALNTRGAGFGEGLIALRAAELQRSGATFEEAVAAAEDDAAHMAQYFTVDDLRYLQKGGRLSAIAAKIGGLLNIKPLLWGDNDGKIVVAGKLRGMRRTLQELVNRYSELCEDKTLRIAISHADAPESAEQLRTALREAGCTGEIVMECYEPITGAHVGPGAVALFFRGPVRR